MTTTDQLIQAASLSGPSKDQLCDSWGNRPLKVGLVPVRQIPHLGELWKDLQARSNPSYFTSWGWIDCWLRSLPDHFQPQVLTVAGPDGVMGLGILNRCRIRRARIIASDTLVLNETGDPAYDELTVERNGFLVDRGMPLEVVRCALSFLMGPAQRWDELMFNAVNAGDPLETLIEELPAGVRTETFRRGCWAVDLADLRRTGTEYLASVTGKTRSQMRRAIRLYEERGPITLRCAGTADEALAYLRELMRLHDARWRGRGKPGAFAHPFVEGFHRTLVRERFPHGEIQMLQVRVGEQPLGYLYNLVLDGHVYPYQVGFEYEADSRLTPGLLGNYLAIEFNLEHGGKVYDFLAGDNLYKQKLGKEATGMLWIVLQRDRTRFRLERRLRRLRAAVRSRTTPGPAATADG